jgi:hypothetical protein
LYTVSYNTYEHLSLKYLNSVLTTPIYTHLIVVLGTGTALDRGGSFVLICSLSNLDLHCSLVFRLLRPLYGLNAKGENVCFSHIYQTLL